MSFIGSLYRHSQRLINSKQLAQHVNKHVLQGTPQTNHIVNVSMGVSMSVGAMAVASAAYSSAYAVHDNNNNDDGSLHGFGLGGGHFRALFDHSTFAMSALIGTMCAVNTAKNDARVHPPSAVDAKANSDDDDDTSKAQPQPQPNKHRGGSSSALVELACQYPLEIAISTVAAIISAGASLLHPLVVARLFAVAGTAAAAARAGFPPIAPFVAVAAAFLGLASLRALAAYLRHMAVRRVADHLRLRLFRKLIAHTDVAAYENPIGRHPSAREAWPRLAHAAGEVAKAMCQTLSSALADVTQILGATMALLFISRAMVAAMAGALPLGICAGLAAAEVARRARRSQVQMDRANDALAGEMCREYKAVRAFAMEEVEANRYASRGDTARARFLTATSPALSSAHATIGFLNAGATVLWMYLAATCATSGSADGCAAATDGAVPLANVTRYAQTIAASAASLSASQNALLVGEDAAREVLASLDMPCEIERESPPASSRTAASLPPAGNNVNFPALELRDITFSYPSAMALPGSSGSAPPALSDITLRFERGKSVALVGASGSGKSTVVSLMQHFYDVDHGNVMINGTEIRNIAPADVRKSVFVVSQDSILLPGLSVAENVAYGQEARSGVAPTLPDVWEACRRACANDFIVRALPRGLETVVGFYSGTSPDDDASALAGISGGQRQRLCLSRAFLAAMSDPQHQPSVFIFDEATSALDAATEARVSSNIRKYICESTNAACVFVAHRLHTITEVDEIVVFDNGFVVERGTYAELMKKSNGRFAELARKQGLSL